MDLRQIEAFHAVATLGSFSAAARRLLITQSAVSSRIIALERDLGALLFDRSVRNVALTAKGIEFYDGAKRVLQLMAEMRHLGAGDRQIRGTVRVEVTNTIAHTWLPRIVQSLGEKYPNVDVDLKVGVSAQLESMLNAQDADVVMTAGEITGFGFTSSFLCRSPVVWVGARSTKFTRKIVSLQELAAHQLMTYEKGNILYRMIAGMFRNQGIWPIRLGGSNSVAAMIELALSGVCICAIPEPVVKPHVAAGRLKIIQTVAALPDVEFFVTYPDEPFNELAVALAEIAVGICRLSSAQRRRQRRTRSSALPRRRRAIATPARLP
jgi:DNA-binding transcriptional LysR family regulator